MGWGMIGWECDFLAGSFSMRRVVVVGVLVLMVGVGVRVGLGAEPTDVAGLVGELRAADFATRERGTVGLMGLSAGRLSEVQEALAKESDPEVIARLERAAVHLFMKARTGLQGDVGVLGITLQPGLVQLDAKSPAVAMSIMVVKAQPGFPAAEVLEPFDQVIAVNGERFFQADASEAFRGKVNATAPGEVVRMTIVRDGKVMEVGVKVAGLAERDVPLFKDIVAKREEIAREFLAAFVVGGEKRVLMVAGGSGGGEEVEFEGVDLPSQKAFQKALIGIPQGR
jgi:PDZ domain